MTREEQIQLASVENADKVLAKRDSLDFAINALADFDNGLTMGFTAGANWADETMIDKACEWLRRNYTNYMINDLSKYVEDVCSFDIFDDLLVDDFRKAMEE